MTNFVVDSISAGGFTARRLSVLLALLSCSATAAQQTVFATPEEAMLALGKAAQTKDQAAMNAILGPDREKLLSGDAVEDARGLARFANNFERYAGLE